MKYGTDLKVKVFRIYMSFTEDEVNKRINTFLSGTEDYWINVIDINVKTLGKHIIHTIWYKESNKPINSENI